MLLETHNYSTAALTRSLSRGSFFGIQPHNRRVIEHSTATYWCGGLAAPFFSLVSAAFQPQAP